MSRMRNKGLKKGDLSLQIVVIAAIALLVLVVLIVIFTDRIGVFSWTLKQCDTLGGSCKSRCDAGEAITYKTDCVKRKDDAKLCCKLIDVAPQD